MTWQPIETAPHGEQVLLGWWTQDGQGGVSWDCEVHAATLAKAGEAA